MDEVFICGLAVEHSEAVGNGAGDLWIFLSTGLAVGTGHQNIRAVSTRRASGEHHKADEVADEQQSDDAPAGVDASPCGRCFYADIFTV